MNIIDFLAAGAENALTAKQLTEILHISRNEIGERIRAERLNGVFICSRTTNNENGRPGYFLPKTQAEAAATIQQLKNREKELKRVRKALEKNYRAKYGA